MAGPMSGNYQNLLLKGADNGRLQAQQRARATIPASVVRFPSPRHVERPSFARRPTPAAGQFKPIPTQQAVVMPPAWVSKKSATMIIKPIPTIANPWDIREFFKKFGNVVWVELDDARVSHRSAKIRFEPPPTDVSFFQQGKCRLSIGGSVSWALVEFPRQSDQEPTMTTPGGNTCPISMAFGPDKLTFGLLTQPTTFMAKKEILKLNGDLELKFTADFRRQKLTVHFPISVYGERQYYRIDMKFGIIRSIYRMASVLVIHLADPPLARKKQTGVDGAGWTNRLTWGEDELWYRAVDVGTNSQNPPTKPVSLEEEPEIIDFGRWTTYWVDLDNKSAQQQWSVIEGHLHDWNIATKTEPIFTRIPSTKPELWDMLADPHFDVSTTASPAWNNGLVLLSAMTHISLPYEVRYQLEVCVSRGILSEYNIGRGFLEKLFEMSKPRNLKPNRARLVLEYAADEGKPVYNPMELFEDRGAMTYYPTTLHIPDYCALVRKVTVTPTRIFFSTPTVETTNRVVRRYKDVQDHFIRVQFTDELLDGRIRASDFDRDDELYARVCRVMTQGIRMGKWHWKFLAFGNSQIRENGAFFFCEPEDGTITCHSIREWMGNFDHISSVAKLAARLGQCFSTTRLLSCISAPQIVKIPDIETKNGFCFTDGVGKISFPLASLVSEAWKIDTRPSAFQFRMGGCKGVLVAWPDAKGTEVHVRPSQEKFSAEYNGLEIIRCSQFSCPTLNRQTILILSCLGVPDDVFIDMMAGQIASYDTAMTNQDRAIELLSKYVDENMTTTTIATMILNGFMDTREPFVRTLLQLWRSWSIKGLKEKARLVVDQGAFLLGCADETGTLRGHSRATEGRNGITQNELPQIFLQVPDPKDRGAYKVVTGICIVGRNPSLHPGDIRVVEAVDVPKLRHLRDVVVFPLKGDRDVPSMCSGGDLDGDDFFVIWDPKLIPPEWSHPPMNYTAPEPLNESQESIVNSLAFFFVLFMKNDRLPLIAHAHLATADYEVTGAKHWKCLKLAELHSTAVDYVKTGIPARWNKKLDPRRYPHFMEKAKAKSYRSTSVLGKLYDMIDKEVFDNRENYKLPFDDRILKRFELGHPLLKEARKIKTQYDISMRRIMGQLEIRTEFEIWAAFVMSKPRVGTDYKVQEKVGRESAGLKKQFRDLCLKVVEEHGFNRQEFIAAMYKVTWEETRIALYEARQPHVLPDGTVGLRRVTARSMPLISFPWLFPDYMGKIALGTERLPNLVELGIVPPSANPMPNGPKVTQLETEPDLAAMDYTKTSDGQFIHRGEILHLFRHNDDGDDGFYYGDGAVSPDPSGDSASDTASKQEQEVKKMADELTTLLNSDVSLDAKSPVHENTDIIQVLSPPKVSGHTAELALLDLLSSDMDTNLDSTPCLTPVRIYAQQPDAAATTETVQSINRSVDEAAVAVATDHKDKGEATSSPDTASVVSDSNASSWNGATPPVSEPPLPIEYTPVSSLPGLPWGGQRLNHAGLRADGAGSGLDKAPGYALNEREAAAALPAYVDPFAPAKALVVEEVVGGVPDEEVEYQEDVIEVEAETTLEKVARFA
ncbi:RNA dependent RNA polymerase-domain-containing protein [Chaetomium tenue]|uniref:RNA dependent RNA polymerase-domain-containing protein n=1 Tax=Chaetomium tenue TaxID=1854479 RepID=A0ACB7P5Q6_9PEZI|nr:RNA dependent RNA polymerase-domain-containing protein [Chaetomium globosum]